MNPLFGGVMYSPRATTREIDMARAGGSYELIDGKLILKHRTQPAGQGADQAEKSAQPEMDWFDPDQPDDDTQQED